MPKQIPWIMKSNYLSKVCSPLVTCWYKGFSTVSSPKVCVFLWSSNTMLFHSVSLVNLSCNVIPQFSTTYGKPQEFCSNGLFLHSHNSLQFFGDHACQLLYSIVGSNTIYHQMVDDWKEFGKKQSWPNQVTNLASAWRDWGISSKPCQDSWCPG